MVDWLGFLAHVSGDRLADDDRVALTRLLDPADSAYVGIRDDLFYLAAETVNLGRRS